MKRLGALAIVAAVCVPLFASCGPDVGPLRATVAAQGALIEQLARTATPTLPPLPTRSPTPSATPSPTPSPVPTATPSPAATPTRTVAAMLEAVLPSVVQVYTDEGEGTGFVAFGSGQVVTAYHVIQDSPGPPTIATRDGLELRAVVLGVDERRDLALLSVPSLRSAPLPFATGVSVAEPVIVVGYSAGLPGEPSITRGIISARRLEPDTGVALLQTDATLNPGASGGPLLDERGEVVGVNVGRMGGGSEQYESIGFAVASEEVAGFQDDVRAGRLKPTSTPAPRRPTPTPTRRP